MLLLPSDLAQQVTTALTEDIGDGDITAQLVPATQRVTGKVITQEDAILCGRAWVTEVFRQLDPEIRLTWYAEDGDRVYAKQTLFEVAGLARPILTGERTALNFLQLLSATATSTRAFVDAVAGTGCVIWDTRKTIPGLRTAQKYAVVCGGGQNYRIGLFDNVLIKENHIAAAGSLTAAVTGARLAAGLRKIKVDVEVETMEEFEEALRAVPDIIMLDEFSHADMRAAVALNNSQGHPVNIEASGGVTVETVRSVAETGVDSISIGSITKHIRALELSMRLDFAN